MRISDWSSDVCSSDLRIGACLRLCHIAAERSYIEDAAAIGNELAVPDCGSGMEHPRAVAFGRIDSADRAALVGCPRIAVSRHDDGERGLVRERHGAKRRKPPRSEEHTSELQSLMRISYAVFCLKQKKDTKTIKTTHQ